jgi:hypothetical protein
MSQIRTSERFSLLLRAIFVVGNVINGTYSEGLEGCEAFDADVFQKLPAVKSAPCRALVTAELLHRALRESQRV